MKLLFPLFLLLFISNHADAGTTSLRITDALDSPVTVTSLADDKKKQKRINKKRKRKCQQFGKKIYAG